MLTPSQGRAASQTRAVSGAAVPEAQVVSGAAVPQTRAVSGAAVPEAQVVSGAAVPQMRAVSEVAVLEARAAWEQARRLEREVPGCCGVWWGRRTGAWLAVVRHGRVLRLVDAPTVARLRAVLLGGRGVVR